MGNIQTPTRRVVLLGASNLTMSFPLVVGAARRAWPEPIEIMAAMGHGRSYGQDSRVLGRKISGIFPCALWQDLQNRPPLPTVALVTDIGNDLLYCVPPAALLEWVSGCLDRLSAAGAATIITQLPMSSVEKLGAARFQLFRRVLFPRCALGLDDVRRAARQLHDGLVALGEARNIPVISVSDAYYGFDPIHWKRGARRQLLTELLAGWRAAETRDCEPRTSLWMNAYLSCLAPHEQIFCGVRRRCRQPSGRLHDGTTISLY